ncbi:hypothetical protein LQW54_005067 [Pestalotiopsis sp. IQ-011]
MTEGHELNRSESLRSNSAVRMTTGSRDDQQTKTSTLSSIGEKGGPDESYRRLDLVFGLQNLPPSWTPLGSSVSSHSDYFPITQQAPIIFEKTLPSSSEKKHVDAPAYDLPFTCRSPAGKATTARDVVWPAGCRRLFDQDGIATERLGQALRDLAKFVIDEYTPKKSLVVTPAKIAAFYTMYQQQSDMIPFADVFTSKASDVNDCLEDFYDRLQCEHLLVQKDSYSRPRVPALSLNGFARYLAICVLAYPNEEIRRLDRIFMDLPLAMDVVELNGSAQGILKTIPEAYRPMKHDPELRKRLDDAFEMLMVDLKMPSHTPREHQYKPSGTSRRSREFDDYFGLPSPGYSVQDERTRGYGQHDTNRRSMPRMPHATEVDFVSGDSSGSNEWVRIRDRRTERAPDSRRPPRSGGSDSPSKNGARMSLPNIPSANGPVSRSQPLSKASSPTIKDPPPSSPMERPVKRVSFSRNPSLRLSTDGNMSSSNISRSSTSSSPSSSAIYTPPRYSPISCSRSPMVEYGPAVSDEKTDGPEDITWRQLSCLTAADMRRLRERPDPERRHSSNMDVGLARHDLDSRNGSRVHRSDSDRSVVENQAFTRSTAPSRPEREPERRSSHRHRHKHSNLAVPSESSKDDREGSSPRDEHSHKRHHRRSEKTANERHH